MRFVPRATPLGRSAGLRGKPADSTVVSELRETNKSMRQSQWHRPKGWSSKNCIRMRVRIVDGFRARFALRQWGLLICLGAKPEARQCRQSCEE